MANDQNKAIYRTTPPKRNGAMFLQIRIPQAARGKRRGIALIWVAIFIFLIIVLVGLSLDTGRVYLVGHQLQNAADAAALAGARVVKLDQSDARQRAMDIAFANKADGDGVLLRRNEANLVEGDIVIGRYYRGTKTFVLNTEAPNAIKVVARRTEESPGGNIALIFGPLFGVARSNIERTAIAITTGGTGAGLIALSPDGTGLKINGNVDLNVNNGAIQVNSADDNAVRIIGQPTIFGSELDVCGDIDPTGGFEDVTQGASSLSIQEDGAGFMFEALPEGYSLSQARAVIIKMLKRWGSAIDGLPDEVVAEGAQERENQ